jgi:hypothetical protein
MTQDRSTSAEPLGEAVAPPREVAAALLELAQTHLDARGRAWLPEAVAAARNAQDRGAFVTAFAHATRRVGRRAAEPSPTELARLRACGVRAPVTPWGVDGVVRAALLLDAAAGLAPGELDALVDDCFQRGDTRERQAVLRALPLFPDPARFVALGVEACRTSVEPVFEAIACDNPYPAAYFPEPSFNQMVLKAVFVGVPVRRVLGLEARITPDLRRMARDYASERRAAGRSVPADVHFLLGESEGAP